MVRRPAAVLSLRVPRRPPAAYVLALPLIALVYFLAAPALPALPAGDPTVLVAGGVGLLMVAATTLALVPARESPLALWLILLGSGLLVGALNADGARGVGAGANVVEAVFAAAAGLLFARALSTPIIAVAVPLFVALVDSWSVFSGPSSQLIAAGPDRVDPLSFDLPAWGDMGSAGQLGLSDALFVAMFAAWALRYRFRPAATFAGLALGLLGSLLLSVAFERAVPALPLIAAGYLLPSIDRVARLIAPPQAGDG